MTQPNATSPAVRGPVVVGYRPSPHGRAALGHGIAEARLAGTRLLVAVSAGDEGSADEERVDELDLDQELDRSGIPYAIRWLDAQRSPSEALVSLAEEVGAVVLVIGLRQRSLVGRLILGATAQRILIDAAVPVLAVKER